MRKWKLSRKIDRTYQWFDLEMQRPIRFSTIYYILSSTRSRYEFTTYNMNWVLWFTISTVGDSRILITYTINIIQPKFVPI